MRQSNNPTAASAVVGEEILLEAGPSRGSALRAGLIMPVVLLAFAGYLLVGIVTMRVPEGTAFPGPEFFPALIAGGMTVFAVLLALAALREWRAAGAAAAALEAGPLTADEIRLIRSEGDGDGDAAADPGSPDPGRRVGVDWRSLAWVVGSFLVFALTLKYLGWIIGAGLLFWCIARGFGAKRPVFSLIVGLTISSLTYIAFDMALGMSLPSGVLGWGF
ncbi:tripartite tricarboxylate transporter TctB family protein [Leucobacter zeae]|nr:tripartite tricarboxylate transporter TctB family protein [Leucobacter zeae]